MFPLGTRGLPGSASEFESALRDGLAIFRSPNLHVETAGEFPRLARVAIDLSGGAAPSSLSDSSATDAKRMTLEVDDLSLTAKPMRVFESGRANMELRASGVQMALQQDQAGAAWLDIAGARTGGITVEMARSELESIICAIAKRAASDHGVSIENVRLALNSTGPHSVRFSADVLAHKLFMRTVVTVSGALAVDDQLNARLSNLTCSGGGIIGSLACSFLQPYIARFDGMVFPLAAFALRGIRVRDLTLDAGEPLVVRATFCA